jgi:hypothetical protein
MTVLQIYLLEHEQSCMPTLRGSNDTHFIIATFYDECNTVQAGNFHVNQVRKLDQCHPNTNVFHHQTR